MRKLALLCCTLLAIGCGSNKVDVAALAFNDQIWGPTYNAVAGKIQGALGSASSLYQEISDKLDLPVSDVRHLAIYATRYTSDHFSIEKVIYRYPHYNRDSIQSDIDQLLELGLMESGNVDAEYQLSKKGQEVIELYWQIKVEQGRAFKFLSDAQTRILFQALRKMVDAALILDDGFKSASILNHQYSLPQDFENFPKIVQVVELLWQYIAFVNDNAHYKYDNFISESDDIELKKFLLLSPLSKELMSATSSGRTYDLNRCYNQPNWRMGKEGCDLAVDELIEHGLVEKLAQAIKHTDYGAVLSQEAEDFADRRRYVTWSDLSQNEYGTFKKLVLSLSED